MSQLNTKKAPVSKKAPVAKKQQPEAVKLTAPIVETSFVGPIAPIVEPSVIPDVVISEKKRYSAPTPIVNNGVAQLAQQLVGLSPVVTQAAAPTAQKITQTYNYKRPTKEGSCLTVWNFMDANPTMTRKQAQAALDGIVNPITVGVQYGHWVKATK
jgi:hypothetical protein